MRMSKFIKLALALTPVSITGCTALPALDQYTALDAGFANVSEETSRISGQQTVWIQSQQQAEDTREQVHSLVHQRTINADTAVQVALLNNRGLQATYAEIGMSATQVWQEYLLENPKVSVEILGISAPGTGPYRSIEGWVANNILAMITRPARVELADNRFRQAQLKAILETQRIAGETRKAWVNAVAAFERVIYLNQAQLAANAASELAQRLGESGAMPKSGQAREHAFYAELTGQRAQARLAAQLAKEQLTRLMGLWGSEVDYLVPDYLPTLPGGLTTRRQVEADALQQRVDLQIAKLELEALANSYGFTQATRLLTDLEIVAGVEHEREISDDGIEKSTIAQVEIEFEIPIFDTGEARLRNAELAYMQAANLLAEKAVNIRSEARSAYTAYRSTHQIARHYNNAILPLRTTISEEALLTYNGMITNTFELLADTRAKLGTILQSVDANREFWLADANLSAAIIGGGETSTGGGSASISLADAGGGGH